MPWQVKEKDDQFCVYKKGASTPIKGGCHDTRDEAVKHMQALYANEKKSYHLAIPERQFSEVIEDTESPNVKWVQAWRYSTWNHPVYGKIEVTPQLVSQFKEHLDNDTLGQEVLVNYDHQTDPAKGKKAAGRVLDIEARDDGGWYKVEFTQEALTEINDKQWRYLSPEYGNVIDHEKGETFENVPIALAITNRPFFKRQAPMNFSELYSEVEPHEQQEEDKDMSEFIKQFGEVLGVEVKDDTTDEDAIKMFSEKITEMKKAAEAPPKPDDEGDDGDDGGDEVEKKFAEDYPDMANELTQLRQMRIAHEAREFADRFSTFKVKEGDKEVTKSLSPVAKDKLVDVHLKFSEGKATAEDVAEVIQTVVTSGVVEFGERGSSLGASETPDSVQGAATALRDRAKQLVEDAGGPTKLSFGDALAKASDESPELAKAYREGR